jgi:site-specific recombinase XerD
MANIDQRPRWELTLFLTSCRARNLSPRTVQRYEQLLTEFAGRYPGELSNVQPNDVREFITYLQHGGHNPAGVWTYYRTLKTFYRWLYNEEIIERDIFRKLPAPRIPDVIQPPIELDEIGKLLRVAAGRDFTAVRDRAVFLTLLDTGLRASEFCALKQADINLSTGSVLVRAGKGHKRRVVFIQSRARIAISKYLRVVKTGDFLWQAADGTPLKYSGLRQIIRRRAAQAGIACPSLHSFRRAFAINALRNGMDLISLQRLLGHANLAVIYRYLAMIDDDLSDAHAAASPVKNLK